MKLERLLQRARGTAHSPPPERAAPPRRCRARRDTDNTGCEDRSRPGVSCRAGRPPLVHRSPTRREEAQQAMKLHYENMRLLQLIKNCHFARGRVDCRWRHPPQRTKLYYQHRVDFAKRVQVENRTMHQRLSAAVPRLTSTAELGRWWAELSAKYRASPARPVRPFDPVFDAAPDVKRPRVTLKLRFREGGAELGALRLELFAETCPRTAALFIVLLRSRPGYVGTCFFRKVPGLFWSGGDVASDCGYGLGLPGLALPIENFHYPHSVPGLLTMDPRDDLVYGHFSITFKPLPQLDLTSVVFGRVVQPSRTFELMRDIGRPLSMQPVVEVCGADVRLPAPAPALARHRAGGQGRK